MTQLRLISEFEGFKPGWNPVPGICFARHPKFGAILHCVVADDDGKPVYDQPVIADPLGAVCIPIDNDGNIYLIANNRPLPSPGGYRSYPPVEFEDSGVASLEFPRGFAEPGESPESTAIREEEEECGYKIDHLHRIGEINPNTTFYLKSIPVFLAEIGTPTISKRVDDGNESVLRVEVFSLDGLLDLVAQNKIFCGFTLASITLYLAWRRKVQSIGLSSLTLR